MNALLFFFAFWMLYPQGNCCRNFRRRVVLVVVEKIKSHKFFFVGCLPVSHEFPKLTISSKKKFLFFFILPHCLRNLWKFPKNKYFFLLMVTQLGISNVLKQAKKPINFWLKNKRVKRLHDCIYDFRLSRLKAKLFSA